MVGAKLVAADIFDLEIRQICSVAHIVCKVSGFIRKRGVLSYRTGDPRPSQKTRFASSF